MTAYRAYVVRVGPALPITSLRASGSEPEADEDLQLRYSWEVAELPKNVRLVRGNSSGSRWAMLPWRLLPCSGASTPCRRYGRALRRAASYCWRGMPHSQR